MPLKIFAQLTFKPGHIDDGRSLLQACADASRSEAGCVSYDIYDDVNNPNILWVDEMWKDQDAIDYHNTTAHFLAFRDAVGDKLDSINVTIAKKTY